MPRLLAVDILLGLPCRLAIPLRLSAGVRSISAALRLPVAVLGVSLLAVAVLGIPLLAVAVLRVSLLAVAVLGLTANLLGVQLLGVILVGRTAGFSGTEEHGFFAVGIVLMFMIAFHNNQLLAAVSPSPSGNGGNSCPLPSAVLPSMFPSLSPTAAAQPGL